MDINYEELDNSHDCEAEEQIKKCLDTKRPNSFFLLAGAGSGKTRTLVNTLNYISSIYGELLSQNKKQIAVITYTNAARNEILRRVSGSSIFYIATIHSFAWELIKPYTNDIKKWLEVELKSKIAENERKQNSPRVNTNTKAYAQRAKEIIAYNNRLENLKTFKEFVYSPDGNNIEKNSLNHAEVIKITSDLLNEKLLLKQILISRFPVLFIDECQDTKADLLKAFIDVQKSFPNTFVMGLFGDTMQKIYLDGVKNLISEVPKNWSFPKKEMNHRSEQRIVNLCNSIRSDIDDFKQKHRRDKSAGYVKVFIVHRESNKAHAEKQIGIYMSNYTNDNLWEDDEKIKFLTIEHDMAANSLGFYNVFKPLYAIGSFKAPLLDGSISVLQVFVKSIAPILEAYKNNDKFKIMQIIKDNSSYYKSISKNKTINNQDLININKNVTNILTLWNNDGNPTCLEVLNLMISSELFAVPDNLKIIIESANAAEDVNDNVDEKMKAIEEALHAPFSEILRYIDYVSGNAKFSTHQGVKGLEFPRVAVIIDDKEAETFRTFSYDKMFGLTPKSDTDIANERIGKETTLDRTKRLFYVTCSRAEESLAIIYYSNDLNATKEAIKNSNWFTDDEIEIITLDEKGE